MNWLIALALRRGWRHGVLKGHRGWLAAGAFALVLRMLQRATAKEESVVYQETLQPGERLIITHQPRA